MNRIDAVCSLIKPCGSLADIGCDHGYVAKFALDLGVGRVIASDLRAKSLDKARKLLAERKNVEFVLSDGFDNLPERVDTAVISGMGGRKIIDILSRLSYKPVLVLGAQHNVKELRVYLIEHGYKITDDFCVFDRGKYYDFIRAEEGSAEMPDELALYYGIFYKRKNPDLLKMVSEQLFKLGNYKQTPENLVAFYRLQEVLKWQK